MTEPAIHTSIGFVLICLITLWFFLKATKSVKLMVGIIIWMLLTCALGLSGFYKNTEAFPPRFLFLLGPGFFFILWPKVYGYPRYKMVNPSPYS